MTISRRYERLEAAGLWRPAPEEQRKEVVTSLGKTTLIICDLKDRTLAHWSLAAIRRSNPNEFPAIYALEGSPDETLELASDEDQMINVLERLEKNLARTRPHPGRLRLVSFLVTIVAVTISLILWAPIGLQTHALSVAPEVTREKIGRDLLDRITRLSGPSCTNPEGLSALSELARYTGVSEIIVVPGGPGDSLALPGGLIVLNRSIIEDHQDPDVAAGFVIAEQTRARQRDPLADVLDAGGVIAAFRLITTGEIPSKSLDLYVEQALPRARPALDHEKLLRAFDDASVRSTPYAFAIDVTGETVIDLIEADPMVGRTAQPILSDREWLLLQTICEHQTLR